MPDRAALDRWKTDLDLGQFACDRLGYRPLRARSDATRRAYRGPHSPTDLLLVHRLPPHGHWIYINPYQPDDRGDIYNLVMNRMGLPFLEAVAFVMGHAPASAGSTPTRSVDAAKAETSALPSFQWQPLGSVRAFLHQRGLADAVLDNPLFANTLGQVGHPTGPRVAFPIRAGETVVGLELKGTAFKGAQAGSRKALGLWNSNWPSGRDVLRFVLVESPLDALAHALLRGKAYTPTTVYLATNGQLAAPQLALLQQYIDQHKPREVLLAFDSDTTGERYSLACLGLLGPPRQEVRLPRPGDLPATVAVRVGLLRSHLWLVRLRVQPAPGTAPAAATDWMLAQWQATFAGTLLPAPALEASDALGWEVRLNSDPDTRQRLEAFIRRVRPATLFVRERPRAKDWNDQLLARHGRS